MGAVVVRGKWSQTRGQLDRNFFGARAQSGLRRVAVVAAAVCGGHSSRSRHNIWFAVARAERRPPRRSIRDGQKAPASESGRYRGGRNPRGRGKPLPYKGGLRDEARG